MTFWNMILEVGVTTMPGDWIRELPPISSEDPILTKGFFPDRVGWLGFDLERSPKIPDL